MFVFAFSQRFMDDNDPSGFDDLVQSYACCHSGYREASGRVTSFIFASMSSKSLIFTPLAILDTPGSGVW